MLSGVSGYEDDVDEGDRMCVRAAIVTAPHSVALLLVYTLGPVEEPRATRCVTLRTNRRVCTSSRRCQSRTGPQVQDQSFSDPRNAALLVRVFLSPQSSQ